MTQIFLLWRYHSTLNPKSLRRMSQFVVWWEITSKTEVLIIYLCHNLWMMAIKLHPFIGDSVTNGRCIMNTNRNTTGSNTTFFQVLLCWNSVLEVVYWQVLSVGYRPDCNKLKIGEKGGVDGLPFCLEVSSSQAPTWRYCQQITFITHNIMDIVH